VQKALDDMVDAFTEAIYGEWFTTHGRLEPPGAESLAMPISSKVRIGANCRKAIQPEKKMSPLLIIIILLLLFGGGGGYYAYGNYGGSGLGGVIGTVLVILLILWLLGMLR
jgi:hypothetical protein